jgi:3-oxoacyl-[acyl-carrier protein] reductase
VSDRVVVIAGASNDSGKAVADRLARDGVTVVALGTSAERLVSVQAAARIEVDLTDAAATLEAAAGILQQFGRIDGVVHLVGGWKGGQSDEDWGWLLRRNVDTLRNTTRAFREALLASGDGRFVMVSSTVVDKPTWSNANYAATKAAAEAWMLALARGWAKQQVAAATIFAVRSLGEGEGETSVAVLADRMASLWALSVDELNGARIPLT